MNLHPVSAHVREGKIWVSLSDGRTIGVPVEWFPRLREASPEDRSNIKITEHGLQWESLDEVLSIHTFLTGQQSLASKNPKDKIEKFASNIFTNLKSAWEKSPRGLFLAFKILAPMSIVWSAHIFGYLNKIGIYLGRISGPEVGVDLLFEFTGALIMASTFIVPLFYFFYKALVWSGRNNTEITLSLAPTALLVITLSFISLYTGGGSVAQIL